MVPYPDIRKCEVSIRLRTNGETTVRWTLFVLRKKFHQPINWIAFKTLETIIFPLKIGFSDFKQYFLRNSRITLRKISNWNVASNRHFWFYLRRMFRVLFRIISTVYPILDYSIDSIFKHRIGIRILRMNIECSNNIIMHQSWDSTRFIIYNTLLKYYEYRNTYSLDAQTIRIL